MRKNHWFKRAVSGQVLSAMQRTKQLRSNRREVIAVLGTPWLLVHGDHEYIVHHVGPTLVSDSRTPRD
jgi:hypothetical protein